MLMMDKNNGRVADLIQKWLADKGGWLSRPALFENIDAVQRGLQTSHAIFSWLSGTP